MTAKLDYSSFKADALTAGVLVDVSSFAENIGFRIPVYFTSDCWAMHVWKPESYDRRFEEERRVSDILWELRNDLTSLRLHKRDLSPRDLMSFQFKLYVGTLPEALTEWITFESASEVGDSGKRRLLSRMARKASHVEEAKHTD